MHRLGRGRAGLDETISVQVPYNPALIVLEHETRLARQQAPYGVLEVLAILQRQLMQRSRVQGASVLGRAAGPAHSSSSTRSADSQSTPRPVSGLRKVVRVGSS